MPLTESYLTGTQLQLFDRDGFLIIPGFYDGSETAELSRAIDSLAAAAPEPGGPMVYFEDSLSEKGKRILSRIEKFTEASPGLSRFVRGDRMMGTVARLLGQPAVLFKEKINFKLPGGGGFTPHQDIQPGWDDYAKYFISVLVTVDESTPENGCLELSAGHHKRGMIGRKWAPLEGSELEGVTFKKYPMRPGDVAFFDCFVPHQSAPNLTSRPRRNLYLTFNRSGEGDARQRYFDDKRKSYPPDNERDPGKEYKFRV